ncbi:MAG: hypothetical protein RLZZ361_1343 [Cyanobacteriota bacterium]|jgi:hypothetical protein
MGINGILAGVLEHISSQMLQQRQSVQPIALNNSADVNNGRSEAHRRCANLLARPS